VCGPYSRRRAYARRDLRAAESDLAVPGLRSEQREGMSGACGMESCARAEREMSLVAAAWCGQQRDHATA